MWRVDEEGSNIRRDTYGVETCGTGAIRSISEILFCAFTLTLAPDLPVMFMVKKSCTGEWAAVLT